MVLGGSSRTTRPVRNVDPGGYLHDRLLDNAIELINSKMGPLIHAASDRPRLSASARISHPEPAPSRCVVDAVQSAWSDARWRRSSCWVESRPACGRFLLPVSRQVPMSLHRGTTSRAYRE